MKLNIDISRVTEAEKEKIKAYLDKLIQQNNQITGIVILLLILAVPIGLLLFGIKLLIVIGPVYVLFYYLHFYLLGEHMVLEKLKEEIEE